MDITSLVGPVLRLVGATSNHHGNINHNSYGSRMNSSIHSNSNATLDRTLGAAATLGITIALYRLLTTTTTFDSYNHLTTKNQTNNKKEDNDRSIMTNTKHQVKKVTIPVTLLHSFLQIILKGFFEKQQQRITSTGTTTTTDDDNNMDCYLQQPTYNDIDTNTSILNHRGFCHCRSISFSLKAPNQIIARECRQGRIRYPHYNTTEDQFQLHPQSNEFLSIYYTKRINHHNNTKENNNEDNHTTIAAHAFCQRCGVHILRAPDSNSFQLQINVNCLLRMPSSNIKIIPYDTNTSMNETNQKEEDSFGNLDSGIALEHQWNDDDDDDDDDDSDHHNDNNSEEESYVQGKHGYAVKSYLHKSIFEFSTFPGTPSTTATTVSPLQESLLPPLSTDGYDDEHHPNNDSSNNNNNNDDDDDDEGLAWTPSTIMDTNLNTEEESTMNLEGNLARFATRDQLKYYMKKHLKNETIDS